MVAAIRNILVLFAIALLVIVGIGLYRQYNGGEVAPETQATATDERAPSAIEPETASVATTTEPARTPQAADTDATMAVAPVQGDENGDEGVVVTVPQEPEAEYFALSVKLIDQGVVEIKSRREDGEDKRYYVHLVTCATLRTGIVAESTDLAGLAERNETPDMIVPEPGTADLTLSRIACASVEN